MESKNSYTWGPLYETLATCEGEHEDKSLQKIFTLFRKLDSAQTLTEVQTLLKENTISEYERNRVNSPCLDGLLVSAFKPKPLHTLICVYPEYVDTCRYYLFKRMVKRSLQKACQYGCTEIVKVHLENGAKIKSHRNIEPAFSYGRIETVKFLIENNIAKDENMYKLFCAACYDKQTEIVEYLLETKPCLIPEKQSEIYLDFEENIINLKNVQLVKRLLNKGIIRVSFSLLDEALDRHDCYKNPDYAMAELLIDRGANLRDNNYSNLIFAIEYGNMKLLQFILSYGITLQEIPDLNLLLVPGLTVAILELLLQAGANPNTVYNEDPIIFSYSGKFEQTKLLLKYGADPKAVRETISIYGNGTSILGSFITRGTKISHIKKLLEMGVVPLEHEANYKCKNLELQKLLQDAIKTQQQQPRPTIFYSRN